MKSIVSLSGGMDSATVLAVALAEGRQVDCVGFFYGSKHNEFENTAARRIAVHYGCRFDLIDLSEVMKGFPSNLMANGGAIPEGHYEARTMSQTVVPGRNLIFISVLSGIAWARGAEEVWLGVHSGDHAIYPDCRPEFVHFANMAVQTGSDGRVGLKAPFLHGNKTSIIAGGLKLKVPYEMTRTCYKAQRVACGKCGSCQERLEAFKNNNIEDPLLYESRAILPKAS